MRTLLRVLRRVGPLALAGLVLATPAVAQTGLATFGSHYMVLRGALFNVFNHPNFGPPQANIQSTAFGTITSTVNDPRVVQLVAKYVF